MTDETYNGWANRETWAVALYINNDQGWQESVLEALREAINDSPNADDEVEGMTAYRAGEIVAANVEEALHEWYMAVVADGGANGDSRDQYESTRDDLGSLWRVDWTEIGAAFLSDVAEAQS